MNIQWSGKQIDQSAKERAVGHASVIMLGENSDNRRNRFLSTGWNTRGDEFRPRAHANVESKWETFE